LGMAIMFITHNLGVIAEMADDVVVMYLGKEVELADVDSTFYDPYHPYTRDLLRSIPRIGRKTRGRLHTITGAVPDPYNIPQGCPYHPRCADYMPGKCDVDREIPFFEVKPDHWTRCLLYE
jgi:peptide/nickel transport system ATP-binding protein